MRVYDLARQLEMSNKELIDKMHLLGIDVKSHSSSIEDNEVRGNAMKGILISGARTSPRITENQVRDGLDDGIYVSNGASPTIVGNTITGNALEAIHVDADTRPTIGRNVVSG